MLKRYWVAECDRGGPDCVVSELLDAGFNRGTATDMLTSRGWLAAFAAGAVDQLICPSCARREREQSDARAKSIAQRGTQWAPPGASQYK